MARNSKRVANRITVNNTVLASLQVHGSEVAPVLQSSLFAGPRGTRVDPAVLLATLCEALEGAAAELSEADLAHAAELSDDEEPRRQRDLAAAAIREKMLSLRDLFAGAYGAGVAASLQLAEALPEQPMLLLQRGKAASRALRETKLKATAKHASLKLNLSSLADELDEVLTPLQAALSDVQREEREAQASLLRKNRATEAWERIYEGVTHIAYGAYVLSGRPDLAARIEPSVRKRSGIEPDPDAPSEPGAEDPAPPAPTPPSS